MRRRRVAGGNRRQGTGAGSRAFGASLLALITLAAPQAGGAAGTALDLPSFGEVVDVRLVVVEAVVTDAEGQPVTDLGKDDFRLFEDGAPVALEHVELIGAPAGHPAAATAPAAGAAGAAAQDPPLRLAIFIDEVHAGAASRRLLLRQMAATLTEALRPADQVMVALFDGTTRVALPFTTNRAALAEALAETETVSLTRLVAESDWRSALDHLYQDAAGDHGWSRCLHIQDFVEQYAQQESARVEQSIGALERFVDSLAGMVGRKAVLHVSDGIPTRPGSEAAAYAQELCSGTGAVQGQPGALFENRVDVYGAEQRNLDSSRWDTSGRWEEVAARANAGNVTVYAFQAGLSSTLTSPDFPQSRPTLVTVADQKGNRQEALFVLADRSGGRAWFDGLALDRGLVTTIHELQSYYLLTYVPPQTAGSEIRRVRLEVSRPELTVRYRKLYRPRSAHEQVTAGLLGRLLYGSREEPSPLRLDLAQRLPAAEERVKARFRLRVPLELLQLVEEGGLRHGRFTAYVAVTDGRGLTSVVRQTAVPVRLAPAGPGVPGEFTWEVEMVLRPGKQDAAVAVAVRDELSGEASFVVRRFDL